MEYRPLNVTLMSAEAIKDVNLFSKMDVYAVVKIAGYSRSKQRTFVDKNCGTNPKWNFKMEFIVDEPYLTKQGMSLAFKLKAQSTIGKDKKIGSVNVPINDLYNNCIANPNEEKVVEYQVCTASGRAKGTMRFSYHFGDKFSQQAMEDKKLKDQPAMAYPGGSMMGYPPQQAMEEKKMKDQPAMAYPGGSMMGYPPPQQYYHQQQPPPATAYPYAPPPPMYGYQHHAPPPPGYGYPQPGPMPYGAYNPTAYHNSHNKPKKGGGAGLGMALGAGLLGGLLVGEMASEVGEAAAYADGYADAMDGDW